MDKDCKQRQAERKERTGLDVEEALTLDDLPRSSAGTEGDLDFNDPLTSKIMGATRLHTHDHTMAYAITREVLAVIRIEPQGAPETDADLGDLSGHAVNCDWYESYNDSSCRCSLRLRQQLATERSMHRAWRKLARKLKPHWQ